MSFYTHVEGHIKFHTEKDFKKAIEKLQEGGWLASDGCWQDEVGDRLGFHDGVDIDQVESKLTIELPSYTFRNFHRVFEYIKENLNPYGHVVSYSTDGCFEGYVWDGNEEKTVELSEWAKEKNISFADVDEDFEQYCEDLETIAEKWMETVR